jgi:hypothetical protein
LPLLSRRNILESNVKAENVAGLQRGAFVQKLHKLLSPITLEHGGNRLMDLKHPQTRDWARQ